MMETSDRKAGKIFLLFAGLCLLALPLIVLAAFSTDAEEVPEKSEGASNLEFDANGKAIFEDFDRLSQEYLAGTATERTLEEYYERRQYPGSPPYIPHKVEEADQAPVDCLVCHAAGGWTEELKRNTPLTPHPDQASCRQCHVRLNEVGLFVANDWMSVAPPRLGRAELPGAPPPIPHELQTRGECIACHVGPGAVTAIRVEHPARGNCRQCHVPQSNAAPFERRIN